MGLDTSHDAWHGPYSTFHEWRKLVAKVAGYEVSGDDWTVDWEGRTGDEVDGTWAKTPDDALLVLLAHSPDDGEIWPAQAEPLANRLEELLPAISRESGMDDIYRCFAATAAKRFIVGLRRAVEEGEPVLFG